MFVSDSLSFAITLLCDLADPDHALDIAKIIAFFTGPKENIIDTFEPPKKSFKIRPPGSEVIEEWHWSNSPESPENTPLANPPWRMLEVRNELWGRRTAVFAGYARKGNEGPETAIPIVMKCAWLPAYLKDYESSILEHIQKALQEPIDHEKYPFLREALEFVDPRVIEYIPRSLGAVQDCERVSRSVLPVEGVEDEDEIEPDEHGLMRLELSVLYTTGPHGERVPTKEGSKLSLKNHCEIQCGIIETLLIVSCCHVHYRDLNTGNILFVVHPVPADGMQGTTSKTTGKITGNVTGYLIDYGNARILSKRRKRLPHIFMDMDDHNAWLALDDARSINAHFICTPMLQVWELASEYRYQSELVRSKERRSTHPGLVKIAKETRQRAIDEQKSITEQIKARPHRFIDGMLIECHSHLLPSLCHVDSLYAHLPRRHGIRVVRAHFSGQFRLYCDMSPLAGLMLIPSTKGGQDCRLGLGPISQSLQSTSSQDEGESLAKFLRRSGCSSTFLISAKSFGSGFLIHTPLLLPLRQVMKELNLDVTAWLYLEWKHVRDIVKTRDAIGTRKLGEELDREEFHCFLRRVTAVREALPGIPDEMLRPGLSTNIEEPAWDEPGNYSSATESGSSVSK
jgi:hypothetical protein